MKVRSGFLRAVAVVVVVLSNLLLGFAQQTAGESARIDRLVALAKLWAAVKYFHPYLAYRNDIDSDGALVKAIPRVNAARCQPIIRRMPRMSLLSALVTGRGVLTPRARTTAPKRRMENKPRCRSPFDPEG